MKTNLESQVTIPIQTRASLAYSRKTDRFCGYKKARRLLIFMRRWAIADLFQAQLTVFILMNAFFRAYYSADDPERAT
ncbi:MAG: hypothetical protein ACLRRI_01980 [Oscillospiraceae bacterium]